MGNSTCETIRLGSGSGRPGVDIQLVSNGQSLQATCAAMAATYYWALRHRAANSRMKASGYVVEVRHV
jgi:hypothetical protein